MSTKLTVNPTFNVFAFCRDKICLDIGANEGGMTESMLQSGAIKVFCFEPGKNLCNKMRQRFLNDTRVEIIETGVSDECTILKNVTWLNAWVLGNPSDIKLPISPGACDVEGYEYVDIPLITIDDYFKNFNEKIEFIKIDVDGYDYKVLKGSKNIIQSNRPIIFIELSYYYDLIKGSSVIDFIKFVKSIDYTYISIDGNICSEEYIIKEFPYHSSCDIFLCPLEKLELFKPYVKY